MFKYPEFTKKAEGKEKSKVETAVLSTTAKVKARAGRKQKEDGDVEMKDNNVEESKKEELTEEEKKKKEEEEKKAKEPEPEFQELNNPSRVIK